MAEVQYMNGKQFGELITAIIFDTYRQLELDDFANVERARNAATAIVGCVDEQGVLRGDFMADALEGSQAIERVRELHPMALEKWAELTEEK